MSAVTAVKKDTSAVRDRMEGKETPRREDQTDEERLKELNIKNIKSTRMRFKISRSERLRAYMPRSLNKLNHCNRHQLRLGWWLVALSI